MQKLLIDVYIGKSKDDWKSKLGNSKYCKNESREREQLQQLNHEKIKRLVYKKQIPKFKSSKKEHIIEYNVKKWHMYKKIMLNAKI